MPGIQIGNSFISIDYRTLNLTKTHRVFYRYWLDLETDGKRIEHYGEELSSGCNHGLHNGLESLLSFLSACGESFGYRQRLNLEHTGDDRLDDQLDDIDDNANLFPIDVAEWCYQNSDELIMLACEIEENPNCILEN